MTSTTVHTRAQTQSPGKSPYLVNPVFDIFFVCGGLALSLIAVCAYFFAADMDHMQQLSPMVLLSVIGTYLFSSPHSAATLFRLYGEKPNRQKFKFVAWGLPAILVGAFAVALRVPALATLEATLYILLIWHHVMAQCYGIAMMYCARAGLRLSEGEKCWPKAVLYVGVTVAIAQQFTAAWQRESFLGVPLAPMAFLPDWLTTGLQAALLCTVAAFFIDQLSRAKAGRRMMPLPAVLTLMGGAVLMGLSRSVSEFVWIFIPSFFHASQYMAVVLAFKFQEEQGRNKLDLLFKNLEQSGNRFVEYFLLGLVLFTALPFIVSACGFSFSLCSALVFFTVNLHHFAADACVWKLKDKTVLNGLTK
ncbi:MAG: hypothetical protein JSS83_28470 [Cyanobacteria bacterium SZAS LIN-3]|nr:hypothetical protein [Cyanobacteria bacterium SZAS LIN-3]